MTNHPVDFHGVTPEAYAAIKLRLEDIGFEVPEGNKGAVNGRMVSADIVYDASKKMLSVSVTELPPATTSGYVVGWVHDNLRAAHAVLTTTPKD